MKTIDILSYKVKTVDSGAPSGEHLMASVGLAGDDAFPAPSVPFPYQDGIVIESVESG